MTALYQNVWAQGDYIYHTTPSGIDVYNSDTSSRISFIDLPATEEERRQVVVFSEPTLRDNYPVPVTLSGSDLVYLYSLDGDDIHFQDMSDNELDFWIENWTYSGISDIWVKVPASGTTSVYMYFDHAADISYGGGDEAASFIFFDDFSVVNPSNTTGLSDAWYVPSEDEAYMLVSGGKLRVVGQKLGAGVYADAYIEISSGYNFQNPMTVQVSLSNVLYVSGAGDGYNQFAIEFTGGTQERDLWGWYKEGTYNQVIRHNDDSSGGWVYGTNIGMTGEDSLITAYFAADYTRIIVDRSTNPFDITYSGTNRSPEASILRMFSAHDFEYDVNYVKITRTGYTCSGTISGTVSSVFYPITTTPTSVWANDDDVYIGTTTAGIYSVPVSTISGTIMVSGTSTVTGTAYKKEPNITSNSTIYLHGAADYLCVSTAAGVDRYNLTTASGIYTNKENIHKCFQTTSGTLYYIENNSFFGLDETSAGLGDSLRNWKYYQHIVFPATTEDNTHMRVEFQLDFPYNHTKNDNGADIRFIDGAGNNLNYYIEEWYPNAIVLVKVVLAGTSELYMLYGNPNVFAQSNPNDTYFFYDDFTTLDTDIWQINPAPSSSITSNGEYITIHDYSNAGTDMMTKTKVPYGYIRAYARRNGGTSFSQFDGAMGYSTSTTVPTWRGYSYLGLSTGTYETPHRLIPYWASPVQGNKYASASWLSWEFVCVEGYQRSVYGEETLEAAGIGVSTENYLCFHQNNQASEPDLQIDWVTVESWPRITTYTTTEQLLWPLIQPKLHVVYTPTENWPAADYVYDEFYGNPLLLNDIHITEETSSYNNDNTVFLATDRGAHVIDERQGDEENANIKRYYIR